MTDPYPQEPQGSWSSEPAGPPYDPAYGQTPYSPAGCGPAPGSGPGVPFVQTAYGTFEPVARWSTRSKLAAGLFGIFLGVFGVHNFYLGSRGYPRTGEAQRHPGWRGYRVHRSPG